MRDRTAMSAERLGMGSAKYLLFPSMTFSAGDDNPLPLPRGLEGTD